MRFSQLLGILVTIAGVASGLQDIVARTASVDANVIQNRGGETALHAPKALKEPAEHHQRLVKAASKRKSTKTSSTSSFVGSAAAKCAAKARKPSALLRRSDHDSDSDYSTTSSEAWMGQWNHLPKSRKVQAVGIDGCSALFIFGSASREFAHLSASVEDHLTDTEVAQAKAAAKEAVAEGVVEDGEIITVYIRSPALAVANAIKQAVMAELPSTARITWNVGKYRYSSRKSRCYVFTAPANSDHVTIENWQ